MSNKEYVICDKTDLVAVADAIREKTGSTDGLTVSGLADAVRGAEVNLDAEITEQENIISLIQAALEGKAASGGGVTVPEMCTINYEVEASDEGYDNLSNFAGFDISYVGIDENNQISSITRTYTGLTGSFTCVKGSWVNINTVMVDPTGFGFGDYPLINNISGNQYYYYACLDSYLATWVVQINANDDIVINVSMPVV